MLFRSPSVDGYQQLRQRAAALAAVEPANVKARACEQIGVLGAWLEGMATQPEDVITALDSLEKLLSEKSEEPRIPFYVAKACLRLAGNRPATDAAGANELRERAAKAFEVALQNQPLTPGLIVREYRTSEELRRIRMASRALTEEQYKQELERHLLMIEQVTAPKFESDRDYTSFRLLHAEVLGRLERGTEAEEQLASLVSSRPYDVPARIRLGNFLASRASDLQRAIAVLDAPIGDDPTLTGIRARLRQPHELERLAEIGRAHV